MKVLVAALSEPAHLNGVSRHAVNLTRALLSTAEISCVHFIAGHWQRELYRQLTDKPDARLRLHWISLRDARVSRLWWYFRELPLIARQLEVDIVHLTYPVPFARNAFPCSAVLSLHDLYPFDCPRNFGYLRGKVARSIMRHCIASADAIACVSETTRRRLEKWVGGEAAKAAVIPNVVEAAPMHHALRAPDGVEPDAFILLIAQHRFNKGVPLAIRVFHHALQQDVLPHGSRLLIVGIPGPETSLIQSQIRALKLGERIHLCHGLSEAELNWCYRNCSLLLAPSLIEGFGLPVAEAALAGCRIVCSDIHAFREIGADCCYVPWRPRMIDAYTSAVREVLASPRPPACRLPQFSVLRVGQRYQELYRDLACPHISEFDMLPQPGPFTS